MKITTPKILSRFPTTSEMFPLKIMSLWYHTNIPISDTVNIINDYVNNDDQFTRKAAI